MQNTSLEWKQTLGCYDYADRPNFVPQSAVEIEYKINDPAAQNAASASDNGHEDYANTAQIVNELDKNYPKYTTLEQNMWVLDNTTELIPENITGDTGYVGNILSGADRSYAPQPIITISFGSVFSTTIPGITIIWSEAYNEWACDFTVTAFNGSAVVATKSVTNNTEVVSFVEQEITGYDKIEITIEKWCLPFRRPRVEEIFVGAVKIYTRSDLLGFELSQQVDLTSNELPTAEVVFDLDNTNGVWNPHNPQGFIKYLLQRQEITVRIGFNINGEMEWIKGGTYWMSEWETPLNGISAKFTARDLLEFMFGKFNTTGITSITLYDLAVKAFQQSNIPTQSDGSVRWIIDDSLKNTTITMPSGFDHTCAETVQLCANAAMCIMYQDRNGVMHVEPLNTTTTDYLIDEFVSWSGEVGI